tara:strand:+ start:2070 stop:2522 length:453 start_codon:yes stop_codon:yes gene_type:complete
MLKWVYMHKAYVEWFHSAHLLSKGSSFAGDHVNLYGKIYQESFDQYDGIIERVIGTTNNEECACPSSIAMNVVGILQKYPSPSNMAALNIAVTALQLNKEYCHFLNNLVANLKQSGNITIGTEDLIAGTCNVVEGYTYLLQQRIKESIGG